MQLKTYSKAGFYWAFSTLFLLVLLGGCTHHNTHHGMDAESDHTESKSPTSVTTADKKLYADAFKMNQVFQRNIRCDVAHYALSKNELSILHQTLAKEGTIAPSFPLKVLGEICSVSDPIVKAHQQEVIINDVIGCQQHQVQERLGHLRAFLAEEEKKPASDKVNELRAYISRLIALKDKIDGVTRRIQAQNREENMSTNRWFQLNTMSAQERSAFMTNTLATNKLMMPRNMRKGRKALGESLKELLQECIYCGKKPTNEAPTKKCGRCRSVYYCSKACQKTDWKKHKETCQESGETCNDGGRRCAGAKTKSKICQMEQCMLTPFIQSRCAFHYWWIKGGADFFSLKF